MGVYDYYMAVQAEIPSTQMLVAILLLIMNIFIPGLGTFIMAFINGIKPKTMLVALIQFFTAFLLIGWIWSIYWGIICIMKAK